MNKVSRYTWNITLALTLTAGSSAVFAKDANTHATRDQAQVEYRCSSTAEAAGATAKSPNGNSPHSCVPVASSQMSTLQGATTAKTPGRPDGHLLTHESTRTMESDRCTAAC